jgi:hypothetical protein
MTLTMKEYGFVAKCSTIMGVFPGNVPGPYKDKSGFRRIEGTCRSVLQVVKPEPSLHSLKL